jgi:hypothetical protein
MTTDIIAGDITTGEATATILVERVGAYRMAAANPIVATEIHL